MKHKKRFIAAVLITLLILTGCGAGTGGKGNGEEAQDKVIDLTRMSKTMIYSEVYNMTISPEEYEGKEIIIKGEAMSYLDEKTGKEHYACVVKDAAACCAQGVEYILDEGRKYAKNGSEIKVRGIFDTCEVNGITVCCLKHASLKIQKNKD